MCKEDLRMGREFASRTFPLTVGGVVPNPALPQNVKRVRLVFAGDGQEVQFVAPIINGVGGGTAFFLTPGSPVVILRIEDVGPLLYEKWTAGGLFAQGDIMCTEVVWEDE